MTTATASKPARARKAKPPIADTTRLFISIRGQVYRVGRLNDARVRDVDVMVHTGDCSTRHPDCRILSAGESDNRATVAHDDVADV